MSQDNEPAGQRRPKRIVSAPRTLEPKRAIPVRLTVSDLAALDALRAPNHRSRSHLIVLAIRRCLADNVWQQAQSPRSAGSLPNPCVDNTVAELSYSFQVLQLSLHRFMQTTCCQGLLEANALLCDAHERIERLAGTPGCEALIEALRHAERELHEVARVGSTGGYAKAARKHLAVAKRLMSAQVP